MHIPMFRSDSEVGKDAPNNQTIMVIATTKFKRQKKPDMHIAMLGCDYEICSDAPNCHVNLQILHTQKSTK